MISIEAKLFEEVDKPEGSKIISPNNDDERIERESTWSGQITGFGSFPSGTAQGHGTSTIFKNHISISNWRGILKTSGGHEVSFIGNDINKDGKFYVFRTFFTDIQELKWMDGLVCILDGKHDLGGNSFVCTGYKLM